MMHIRTRAFCRALLAVALTLTSTVGALAAGGQDKRVAIITPYQSAPTTNEMIATLVADGTQQGWKTSVVDTRGDMGQMVSRMEDAISSKVDALVIVSVDSSQVQTQIDAAHAAGIPVFGIDSKLVPSMTANSASNEKAMSRQITEKLFAEMGDKGNVVVMSYRAHPGVLARTLEFYDVLKEHPNIHVLTEEHVQVPGQIQSARTEMDDVLLAHPQKDAIGGVWAGWDDPAIGATQAIMAANRSGIVVTGIDGNTQAVALIRQKSPFVATVHQDFKTMVDQLAKQIALVFDGKPVQATTLDAPTTLITADNAK